MTQNTNISVSGFYQFCKKTRENVAIEFFCCDQIFSSFIMDELKKSKTIGSYLKLGGQVVMWGAQSASYG